MTLNNNDKKKVTSLSYRSAFMILLSLLQEKNGHCLTCPFLEECTKEDPCAATFYDFLLGQAGEEEVKYLTCETCPLSCFCLEIGEEGLEPDSCTEIIEYWVLRKLS